MPNKVQFYLLSKVEPGSKCSASQKGLRSFQVKKLGKFSSSLATQEAKSSRRRRGRKSLTPSIFDREAYANAVPILTCRLSKAEKINSTVIKTENISSYETGTQEREQIWSTGGSLVTPMSLEISAFMEEIQTLHAAGMGETGPPMEIPLQIPTAEVTRGVKNLIPKPQGKKLLVKSINTANPEVCISPDHDYYWNELAHQPIGLTENNQIFGDFDLFPDLKLEAVEEPMIETQVPNQAITNTQINFIAENNTVEEIIVPVVTADPIEGAQSQYSQPTQYVIIKTLRNENNGMSVNENNGMSVNDEWSANSLFPELQSQEEDLTAHNPLEVTGQIISEDTKPEVDENPFTASGGMDLLATVLDDAIDVNSEEFQNFIKVDAPEPEMSTLNFADIMGPSTSAAAFATSGGTVEVKEEPMEYETETTYSPVKRGRGRPRVPRTLPEPPRRPRGRPPSTPMYAVVERLDYESSSAMSSEEHKDMRYKRMRELNNAASKRCRINRKMKFHDMEEEQTLLAARNMELKNKVVDLESQVSKFKTAIFDMIKKRKTEQVQTRTEQVQARTEQVQTSSRPAAATTTSSLSTINESMVLSFDLDLL